MAKYPGAEWRPIDSQYLPNRRMSEYNRVNLHVAVSEAASLWPVFNKPKAASSHFYVRRNGTAEQYIDTAYQGEADVEGNDATISIETQGGMHNADTEQWTAAQVETLAQIYAWAVKTHGIKLQIASSSQRNSTSHGLSWHRLGIDGNFPALPDPGAGRNQRGGGMYWSTSRGKLCPGRGKILQARAIYDRAVSILNNTTPAPAPVPEPVLPEEEEMIIVLNKSNNATIIVSGGRSAPVVGWDQYVVLSQTLPSVGVSDAQFNAFVKAFPLTT